MKKVFVLFLLGAMIYSCSKPMKKVLPKDWSEVSKSGCYLQFPNSWEMDTSGIMSTSILLFSPLENEMDRFKENVNLIIQDNSIQKLSLDSFTNFSLSQINALISPDKNIPIEKTEIAGIACNKLVFSASQGDINLLVHQYYLIHKKSIYILTFTCESDKYEKFKVEGESIIQSFFIE